MYFTAEYKKYLKTEAWENKRRQAFEHYGRSCMLCGSSKNLEVHHRKYDNLMNEKMEDLTIICKTCHAIFHETKRNYKKKPKVEDKPTSNIVPAVKHSKYLEQSYKPYKLLTKDGMIRKGTKCPFINICVGKNDLSCYKECSKDKRCKKARSYDLEGFQEPSREESKKRCKDYNYRKTMYADVVGKASDYRKIPGTSRSCPR